MRFYTNAFMHMGSAYIREIIDGIHVNSTHKIRPYLFKEKPGGDYTSFDGVEVAKVKFKKVGEARDFIKLNEGVEGGPRIYGSTNWLCPFINDAYPGEIKFDPSQICVAYIDIETEMGRGKVDAMAAEQAILSITIDVQGVTHVFACVDYDSSESKVNYVKCADEDDLITRFLGLWTTTPIDVVTGWFIDLFDIPYLVSRIDRLRGEGASRVMSPWGIIEPKEVLTKGSRPGKSFDIKGISIIDYYRAYRKFTYVKRETYRLDYVASIEGVGQKLDYSEFSGLAELYEKNPQKFIDYNIIDVVLVKRLNDKLKLLDLIFTVAYYFKISYDDTFGTTKAWETLVHNHLMNKRVVVPLKTPSVKEDLDGGYVKSVHTGRHKWVVSFDFDSLYPHIVMALNISNETIVGQLPQRFTVEELLAGAISDYDGEYAVTGSCHLYRKDKHGFFPELMSNMYEQRKTYRALMKEAKQKKQATSAESEKKDLDKSIASMDAMQKALKYALNSGYGAMANIWFLWFDMRMAESITLSGQLATRFMLNRLNEYLNKIMKTGGKDYIIAADTDSVYICLDSLVERVYGQDQSDVDAIVTFIDEVCKTKITPKIDEIARDWAAYCHAYDHDKLHMKRETIASVGIWTAKKKYALNAYDIEDVRFKTPELKVTGLEQVKSTTPGVCRDKLKEALNIVMNKDEPTLHKMVAAFKKEFYQMRFEEIASPTTVNGIGEYSDKKTIYKPGTPMHCRSAILYNLALSRLHAEGKAEQWSLIEDGDSMRYCHVLKNNPLREDVFACIDVLPPEMDMERYIDYDVQFQKTFLQPLDIILKVIGWHHTKRDSLAAFF